MFRPTSPEEGRRPWRPGNHPGFQQLERRLAEDFAGLSSTQRGEILDHMFLQAEDGRGAQGVYDFMAEVPRGRQPPALRDAIRAARRAR